jgi:hypothetical protein
MMKLLQQRCSRRCFWRGTLHYSANQAHLPTIFQERVSHFCARLACPVMFSVASSPAESRLSMAQILCNRGHASVLCTNSQSVPQLMYTTFHSMYLWICPQVWFLPTVSGQAKTGACMFAGPTAVCQTRQFCVWRVGRVTGGGLACITCLQPASAV